MAENFRKVLASIRTAAEVKKYAALYNEAFASVIAEDDNAKFDETDMYEKFITLIQTQPIWQDLILKTQGKNTYEVINITKTYPGIILFDTLTQIFGTYGGGLEIINQLTRFFMGHFDLGYTLSSHGLIRKFMDSPEGKKYEELYNILSDLGIMFQNFITAVGAIEEMHDDRTESVRDAVYSWAGNLPVTVNFNSLLQTLSHSQGVKKLAKAHNKFFQLPISASLFYGPRSPYSLFSRTDLYEKLITLLTTNSDWRQLVLDTENKTLNEIKMLIGKYPDELQAKLVSSALAVFVQRNKAALEKKIEESLDTFDPVVIYTPLRDSSSTRIYRKVATWASYEYVISPHAVNLWDTLTHNKILTKISNFMLSIGKMMHNFRDILKSLKEEEISDF